MKYKEVKFGVNFGYAGAEYEDIIEVPENFTDEEIDQLIHDIALEQIEWHWTV